MHPKVRGFGLANNGPFWGNYVNNVFLPYMRVVRDTYFTKLVPTFDDSSAEAEKVTEEVWERLGKRASSDSDPSDLAEAAHDAGVDHFLMLMSAKQTLANLHAVALHHLLEQQQVFLLHRELLHPTDEDDTTLLTRSQFVIQLKEQGIDPTTYDSWESLDDLRLVANSVKHGDGPSVEDLKKRRPEFFTHPQFRDQPLISRTNPVLMLQFHRVYQPLAGDDLYVSDDDLAAFFDSAEAFWNEIVRDFYAAAGF